MEEVALSTKERHQLLSVLRELDPASPPEKRRQARRDVLLTVAVRIVVDCGQLEKVRATVLNVAARGAGLRLKQRLRKGDKLLLPLAFREGGGWLVLCEVRNCTPLERGFFKIGCKFKEKIDDPTGQARPPLDWIL